MKLRINGEPREIDGASNIGELITALAIVPATILVEHNSIALRRDEWTSRTLADGDQIEILRIAAGG